ncbi:MAG: hypothetical protein RL264_1911 [Bacteroidota bacterium]
MDIQLNEQFQNGDFVKSTLDQIEKDFRLCGLDFCFSNREVNQDNYLIELSTELQKLSGEQLFQFLYILDITPQKLMETTDGNDFLWMAKLVVERAAKKVYLRRFYSS